jgi:hypothetical protein
LTNPDKIVLYALGVVAVSNFYFMFRQADNFGVAFSVFLVGMICTGFSFALWHQSKVNQYEEKIASMTSARMVMEVFAARSRNKQSYDDNRIDPLLRKASSTDSGAEMEALYAKAAELWLKEQKQQAADRMSAGERTG